jgi:hypothetical protein
MAKKDHILYFTSFKNPSAAISCKEVIGLGLYFTML